MTRGAVAHRIPLVGAVASLLVGLCLACASCSTGVSAGQCAETDYCGFWHQCISGACQKLCNDAYDCIEDKPVCESGVCVSGIGPGDASPAARDPGPVDGHVPSRDGPRPGDVDSQPTPDLTTHTVMDDIQGILAFWRVASLGRGFHRQVQRAELRYRAQQRGRTLGGFAGPGAGRWGDVQ